VQIKAILRSDTPSGIRMLAAGLTLDIRVRDTRNKEVDRRTVTLNRWSSAEWSWTVPAEGTLGTYAIEAWLPGTQPPAGNDATPYRPTGSWLKQIRGSFLVAAYRRPDFSVNVTLSTASADQMSLWT
jgi:uncharacterized protein YfaS (alpha-2-macroglobulin family)